MGVSSSKLCALEAGDYITDMVGPLGRATHIEKFGTVICACGGVGTAPMMPIVAALKQAGNRVITVLAARNKDLIILEEQMRNLSDEVIVMTDDGSYGTQGLVTNGVESVINREKVDLCVTIGLAGIWSGLLTHSEYGVCDTEFRVYGVKVRIVCDQLHPGWCSLYVLHHLCL